MYDNVMIIQGLCRAAVSRARLL